MMKPIPRSLLIHTAAVVAEKTDRWGEISETSTETLKYVRIEPTESYTSDKQNNRVKVDAVMYYDCRNSSPSNFKFVPGAKVIFPKAVLLAFGGVCPVTSAIGTVFLIDLLNSFPYRGLWLAGIQFIVNGNLPRPGCCPPTFQRISTFIFADLF